MKAICLASVMIVVLLIAVTFGFRLFPTKQRVRQMMLVYVVCVLVFAVVWTAAPADCGFLPPGLLAEPPWLDLSLGLFFFSCAFFGGVLQLYNLADRGFSLRMLIDVLQAPSNTCSVDALMTGYGGGQGIDWMYNKRLRGMLEGQFVVRKGDAIVLTAKGVRVANTFIRIRHFLKLGTIQ